MLLVKIPVGDGKFSGLRGEEDAGLEIYGPGPGRLYRKKKGVACSVKQTTPSPRLIGLLGQSRASIG